MASPEAVGVEIKACFRFACICMCQAGCVRLDRTGTYATHTECNSRSIIVICMSLTDVLQ